MELYLIRHGIAEEHQPGLKDEERQLTPEGREKTEKIAQRLVKLSFNFDLILTSPLVRAYQTAEILIAAGLSSQLETSDHLSFDGNIQNWWQEWLKPRKYPQKTTHTEERIKDKISARCSSSALGLNRRAPACSCCPNQ